MDPIIRQSNQQDDLAIHPVDSSLFSLNNLPLVHQQVELQASRQPDSIAIECNQQTLTYRELDLRANQLASFLRSKKVGKDSFVALYTQRSIEQLITILAILKTGAAYVPLDKTYPQDRLQYMLKDCGASLLLTDDPTDVITSIHTGETILLSHLRSTPFWVHSHEKQDLHPNFSKNVQFQETNAAKGDATDLTLLFPKTNVSPNDVAYLIYTSGSTGVPKGVMMPHGALTNLLLWQKKVLPSPARTLQFTPVSFDVSFQEIFSTWQTGGTLVLLDESLRQNPQKLWQFIVEEKIERLFLPFVALQQLAEVAKGPCSLNDVITAGEQLRITPAIRRMFSDLHNCKLHNHYGPSETHVVTAYTLQNPVESWPSLPPIGRPIDNVTIHLIDSQGNPTDSGQLYVTGQCLFNGYLNKPELTAEKSPVLNDGNRAYATGDLARWLPDGNLEFLGRIDNQVKIRGFRVEPSEVEIVLGHHPEVHDVAVVVKSDKMGDNRLIAYLLVEHQDSVTGIRNFAHEKLPHYLVPSLFLALKNWPLTPSGKVDRRALPDPETFETQPPSAPRSHDKFEQTLFDIWREILDHSNFTAEENFFEVGGDSIRITRVHRKLSESFGSELEISVLFEHPTIRSLAAHLSKGVQESFLKRSLDRASKRKAALATRHSSHYER